jgi:hypothetical protein
MLLYSFTPSAFHHILLAQTIVAVSYCWQILSSFWLWANVNKYEMKFGFPATNEGVETWMDISRVSDNTGNLFACYAINIAHSMHAESFISRPVYLLAMATINTAAIILVAARGLFLTSAGIVLLAGMNSQSAMS